MLDAIVPKLYALAKQHALVKKLAKPMYQFLGTVRVKIRHLGKTKIIFPPVTDYFGSSAQWVNEQAGRQSQPTYIAIDRAKTIVRRLPRTADAAVNWKFSVHQEKDLGETFLLKVPEGRVVQEGYIVTPHNQLLGDVSKIIRKSAYVVDYEGHPLLHRKLPPVEFIDGRVAAIAVPFAGTNYFHWMLELLPRIHLIERGGESLDSIDYFVVNDYASRFQRETLERLGISKERVLESQWHPHLQAKELLVPSFPCDTGHYAQWQCAWVKQTFGPACDKPGHRRLYLNRRKVSYRRVRNEPAIERLLLNHGFESLDPGDFTVREQAQLFSEAEVIVAAHGAALANIVFCQPGTRIVELLHPRALNLMYWTLSETSGLNYNYLLAEGDAAQAGEDPYDNFVDLTCSVAELSKMLIMLNLT